MAKFIDKNTNKTLINEAIENANSSWEKIFSIQTWTTSNPFKTVLGIQRLSEDLLIQIDSFIEKKYHKSIKIQLNDLQKRIQKLEENKGRKSHDV